MIRSFFCALLALWLLTQSAFAEEPQRLPDCTTIEQVEALVRYPAEGALPVEVERGKIRYISQGIRHEPDFCDAYWIGGEPGSELDLTLEKDSRNRPYDYFAGNMCTRAAYSMALSYLGVDMTPGQMSALLGKRDIPMHYDRVTKLLPEIERVTFKSHIFRRMFEAYQTDDNYSPVYVYIQRPEGTYHSMLVVAQQEDGQYIVVDSKYHEIDGEIIRIYRLRFNKQFKGILSSDFHREQTGSKIIGFYQWRLLEE